MVIRAVVFDVGNVLELSEDNYVFDDWAARLGLTSGEFDERMQAATDGGDLGTITLEEVHRNLGETFGIDEAQVNEIMEDMWREYLGTANTELTAWARGLRPRYKTGILSNSFVGAREREQAAYGYMDFIDDREAFARAARDLGMHAIHFTGDNAKAIAEMTALLAR